MVGKIFVKTIMCVCVYRVCVCFLDSNLPSLLNTEDEIKFLDKTEGAGGRIFNLLPTTAQFTSLMFCIFSVVSVHYLTRTGGIRYSNFGECTISERKGIPIKLRGAAIQALLCPPSDIGSNYDVVTREPL